MKIKSTNIYFQEAGVEFMNKKHQQKLLLNKTGCLSFKYFKTTNLFQ